WNGERAQDEKRSNRTGHNCTHELGWEDQTGARSSWSTIGAGGSRRLNRSTDLTPGEDGALWKSAPALDATTSYLFNKCFTHLAVHRHRTDKYLAFGPKVPTQIQSFKAFMDTI